MRGDAVPFSRGQEGDALDARHGEDALRWHPLQGAVRFRVDATAERLPETGRPLEPYLVLTFWFGVSNGTPRTVHEAELFERSFTDDTMSPLDYEEPPRILFGTPSSRGPGSSPGRSSPSRGTSSGVRCGS
jgi:hypothetical protein